MIRKLRTERDNQHLKVPKEIRVFENPYYPLWGIANLGGMDCHDYALDWLKGFSPASASRRKADA